MYNKLKCNCKPMYAFTRTPKARPKVSGQNGPWTKMASTKTDSTETAPYRNGLYPKWPLTGMASNQDSL